LHVDHGGLGARLAPEAPPADAHLGRVRRPALGTLGRALEHLAPRHGGRLLARRGLLLTRRAQPLGAAGALHAALLLQPPDLRGVLVLAGGAVDAHEHARRVVHRLHHRRGRRRGPTHVGLRGGTRHLRRARVPTGGGRGEGFLARPAHQLEGPLGGGAAGLVRVDEEGQPTVLLLDGVLRGGGAGLDAEDRAPAAPRGGVGLVHGERVGDAGERRAEPLGPAGMAVRAGDVAGEEELLRVPAGLLGLLSLILVPRHVPFSDVCWIGYWTRPGAWWERYI
jgi:hypothetical protein